MRFNEFINKVKSMGGIDKDGAYGKQCMDLWNYYAVNVLGLQDGKTGASCAKEILNNRYVMQNVERINNYPEFVPQKGDVAVWMGGQYGHVAICLGIGNVNTFISLDQNWQSQRLTEETHNYTYLAPLVFLRPKNQANIQEKEKFWVRVDKEEAAVRSEPNQNSPQVGSKVLYKGNTFEAVGTVEGENVGGNNIWYKSWKGNYVWSGGLTRM